MKQFLVVALLAAVSVISINGEPKCTIRDYNIPKEWIDMVDPCMKQTRAQVQTEINAAMTYLRMAAYFSQDHVNRPGFAKHFFEAASEERGHARKLIEYLLMRGKMNEVKELIKVPHVNSTTTVSWANGVSALKDALMLETEVTKSIKILIKKCETPSELTDEDRKAMCVNKEEYNFINMMDKCKKEPTEESQKTCEKNEKIRNNKLVADCLKEMKEMEPSEFNDYHFVDYLTGEFLEEQYQGQRDLAGKISTLGKMMEKHGALGEFLFDKSLME